MKEAIDLINKADDFSVLAHPGQSLKDKLGWLDGMVGQGIEGLECYSSYHDQEQSTYFLKQAERLDILVTCGSDYLGKTKPLVQMGEFGLDDPKILEIILNKFCKKLNISLNK